MIAGCHSHPRESREMPLRLPKPSQFPSVDRVHLVSPSGRSLKLVASAVVELVGRTYGSSRRLAPCKLRPGELGASAAKPAGHDCAAAPSRPGTRPPRRRTPQPGTAAACLGQPCPPCVGVELDGVLIPRFAFRPWPPAAPSRRAPGYVGVARAFVPPRQGGGGVGGALALVGHEVPKVRTGVHTVR